MKPQSKPYVAHDCRNPKCTNRFIAIDDNGVSHHPPKTKYCDECQLFFGYVNTKDPIKVARGKLLAEKRRKQLEMDKWLEDL